ncbi:DeoR/GlpR family DNA-binding transcription regulator [Methyloligella sp. 2.7D]|uniref:DeoR/GlpR family DNA-binding transcription regulator n=1 Tax=unclassified Methyloligella TaxID=2625955 RepID=UPI00157E0B51|nr:DeoR/GlpR family DNA-binding transcription regulator [Methyloligella sp. GL2]QKP75995.1 DeoR/GlpR transcriptional regulator [Methyloligella sp. GL2]
MSDFLSGEPAPDRKLSRAERLRRILAILRVNSSIRLSALAEQFGVSGETIRRDLEKLRRQGLINRTYGGAALVPLGVDPSLNQRLQHNAPARDAMAERAVTLVKPGEVLFISSGVSTLQFAQHLAQSASNLTVLTTSLNAATALGANSSIRVILTPGDLEPNEAAVAGPETSVFIEKFRANTVFIGASGLTVDGPYESLSSITWNVRTMIERSQKAVLLADHSKFGNVRLELICDLMDLDVLITDQAPEGELAEAIDAAAIEVMVATPQYAALI